MGDYRMERYDKDSTRILCADTDERPGWVVAMIERLANGRHSIFVGDRRYTPRTFATPAEAFKWWNTRVSTPKEAVEK